MTRGLLSVLVAAAVVAAAPAHADPIANPVAPHLDQVAVAYAAGHDWAVCSTLDSFPSVPGVVGILRAVEDDGLTDVQAGQSVAISVINLCPWHKPLLQSFVRQYGRVAA